MLLTDRTLRPLLAAAVALSAPLALATELRVEIGQSRSPALVDDLTDQAVRRFARQSALLGRSSLELRARTGRLNTPFTLPLRVVLTQNGVPIPPRSVRAAGTGLNLVFETVGPRVFPGSYRTVLENTFGSATPTMDIVFGQPATGGDVHVLNYDADIQDRYAVGGGYYVPNGLSGPEIRFPVYNDTVVSAPVNFIHCLLLAYQGVNTYPFDAVEEGVVRAATMRVVRTPGALPGNPDPDQVEAALDSLYDVSSFYDWYNQPALGCRDFIAPNLLNVPLPPGGSTGGIYLARYQMAGSAWSKVITEHPGFLPPFNAAFYANPAGFQTMDDFAALGQTVIDTLVGGTGTVEGKSFSDWVERQYILDASTTARLKILVQPFPIDATGGTSDFGVFAIEANAFRTAANGDESLLAGTSYPIYWRPDFQRFFASVQDDQIKFAGAYGSVVPNFVGSQFGGAQYRVAVDVPFLGMNTRTYLPAGSYSTGANPLTKNFFGTIVGLPPLVGGPYEVSVEWGGGGSQTGIAVNNFAFGHRISDATFNNAQQVTVRVFANTGTPVELFNRKVNKGVGMLALTLFEPSTEKTHSETVEARLLLKSVPLQPYRVRPTDVFGTGEGDTLFARWNPTTVRYDLFPDAGEVMSGLGFYLRLPSQLALSVRGTSPPKTPLAVSLQPGWNAVGVPFAQTLGTGNLSFTVATEAISTFVEAQGTIIGNTVFEFVPDVGNPDTGTMLPTTSFEPGKGYFVRALRPEGGVIVFTPTDFPFNGGGGGGNLPIALGAPTRTNAPGVTEKRWETKLEFSNPRGTKTHVIVGQSTQTRRGFDPVRDTELPPTPGGFQAALMTGRPMFREIGVWGDAERIPLVVTGLRIGERIALQATDLVGRQTLYLYDAATGRTSRLSSSTGRYVFYATAATQSFEVIVGGRR